MRTTNAIVFVIRVQAASSLVLFAKISLPQKRKAKWKVRNNKPDNDYWYLQLRTIGPCNKLVHGNDHYPSNLLWQKSSVRPLYLLSTGVVQLLSSIWTGERGGWGGKEHDYFKNFLRHFVHCGLYLVEHYLQTQVRRGCFWKFQHQYKHHDINSLQQHWNQKSAQ